MEKRKKLSKAGKRGATKRWGGHKPPINTSDSHPLASKVKESKVKESKKSSRNDAKASAPTDLDFIQQLKANPAYKGVDIDKELAKMDAWFLTPKGRHRQKTHQFILNWLNKCDTVVHTAPTEADQLLRRILK